MNNNKKISRRKLFKQLALSFTIPSSFLWYFGTKRKINTTSKERILIPSSLPEGISFLKNSIIHKNSKNIKAFSSKCTHLGCKINSVKNDQLVCPCHGSKFNLDGAPQNGPATKPLSELEIIKDKSTEELVIYV